jgi:hypothetical protein
MVQKEQMESDTRFYKFTETENMEEKNGIINQIHESGFTGNVKVYHLGYDYEDSISLVVEGNYKGEECCWAVGYGMNRRHLAFRQKWYRYMPPNRK